jgi:hypothetical protein
VPEERLSWRLARAEPFSDFRGQLLATPTAMIPDLLEAMEAIYVRS